MFVVCCLLWAVVICDALCVVRCSLSFVGWYFLFIVQCLLFVVGRCRLLVACLRPCLFFVVRGLVIVDVCFVVGYCLLVVVVRYLLAVCGLSLDV